MRTLLAEAGRAAYIERVLRVDEDTVCVPCEPQGTRGANAGASISA